MQETELAEHVIAYLEDMGWDVYQEVKYYGGRADIVAVHDGWLTWVVECKTSLSLALYEQATSWQAHYRSIAIPESKRHRAGYSLAKFYKVGIMVVDERYGVNERTHAPLMRHFHKASKKLLSALEPEHKTYAKAGSQGSHWSPYKSTILTVERFIIDNPGCTLKEVIDSIGKRHYAHVQSARQPLRKNLEDLHSDWCIVDKTEKTWRYYHKKNAPDELVG